MTTQTFDRRGSVIPVRTILIEILEGPGKGRTLQSQDFVVTIGSAEGNDLVIRDLTLSRFHCELRRRRQGIEVRDTGSKNGIRTAGVSIQHGFVDSGTVLRLGNTILRVSDGRDATAELYGDSSLCGIIGGSAPMRRLMSKLQKIAPTDAGVLIQGESGTGKELVARAIHELSPRASGPFVTIDCSALSPSLAASELLGHEKNAFTGASKQFIGAFERADGGSVFLDEIGELTPELQTQMLGVLERRTLRRLGGSKEIKVDFRLLAATHRDLRSEVNDGRFRLDLYYRIAVVFLRNPLLRDRPEDIPLLVEHFARAAGFTGPIEELFAPQVMADFESYPWPGNVRELRNLVESSIATGSSPVLASHGDPRDIVESVYGAIYKEARAQVLADFEYRYISQLLERSGNNVSKAARSAGMDRSFLSGLIKKHGLR